MIGGSNYYMRGDLDTPDDANEFHSWLLEMPKDKFPLDVFVEGITIRFKEKKNALYFCLGWECRRDLPF